jgi:hypothetical protein
MITLVITPVFKGHSKVKFAILTGIFNALLL